MGILFFPSIICHVSGDQPLPFGTALSWITKFISEFPSILNKGSVQQGKSSYYKRRGVNDSELSVEDTISQCFDLLRTVDNEKYPAYFNMRGHKYIIQIEKYKE